MAYVGGQLPYFDSINFVVSFIAQILYILKYNENWSLWIFVNIANFLYWSILSVQMVMGDNTVGTLGANLSQVALQAALLFNAVYAQKVWASGVPIMRAARNKLNYLSEPVEEILRPVFMRERPVGGI